MLGRVGFEAYGLNAMSVRAWLTHPQLVLVHWPDQIFWSDPPSWRLWLRICRVFGTLAMFRLRGARIVWLVHNLGPHDLAPKRARIWEYYTSVLARLASGSLTLAPSTGEVVLEAIPELRDRPQAFIWHPPYHWSSPVHAEEARRLLGYRDDETIFAHVGMLRPYKGLADFVRLFIARDLPDTRLVLAGEVPSEQHRAELAAFVAAFPAIDLHAGRLDAHTYNLYLEMADVFVAPYNRFLHSGAVVHALCRGCVVIAPDAPFIRDLAVAVGEEWIVRFTDHVGAETLREACARAVALRGCTPNLGALKPEANLDRLRHFIARLGIEPTASPDAAGAADRDGPARLRAARRR